MSTEEQMFILMQKLHLVLSFLTFPACVFQVSVTTIQERNICRLYLHTADYRQASFLGYENMSKSLYF